jgi:poly-gamma-glutamate synthesis protein (capsule biosynthesis protein)
MDAPLEETIHHLTQLGYPYIGVGQNLDHAFQPYVNEINGVSFAVIAASRVIPTTDWIAGEDKPGMASAYTDEPLLSTIKHWAAQVDLVIVFLHWGEERGDHPNEIQLELEQKLASAGANLIIGSHPHVLQEFKWRNKKQATAFSLGNFVFTTSTTETANYTMALDIQVTSDKITKIKIWPGKIDFGLIRYLDENNDERAQVIERLQQLSPTIDIERDGKVRKKEK